MTKVLIIFGPTATGKTQLALQLTRKFQGELISADSRQVYKGLDIGTGKLSIQQLNNSTIKQFKGYWIVDGIKIHGFDLVDPPSHEPGSKKFPEPGSRLGTFTVADFLEFAHTSMIRIIEVNRLPIIVGGTGFYIKALTEGVGSIGIPADQKLRKKLEKMSADELYQKLLDADPHRAASMNQSDRANPRRLIRAIEIAQTATYNPGLRQASPQPASLSSRGEHNPGLSRQSTPSTLGVRVAFARPASLSSRGEHTPGVSLPTTNYKLLTTNYLLLGLTAPNDYLYQRADQWLQERLDHDMIGEVKNLLGKKVDPIWLDNLGIEYRWLSRYVLEQIDKEEALKRLKGDIHNFIRRQKTWFKQLKGIQLFDITKLNWRKNLEKTVRDWYTTCDNG